MADLSKARWRTEVGEARVEARVGAIDGSNASCLAEIHKADARAHDVFYLIRANIEELAQAAVPVRTA